MAGLSLRFQKAGYTEPKFKLSLAGQSVFSYAVRSFESYFHKDEFLFIYRTENGIENFISKECKSMGIERPILAGLSGPTRGQAETVFQGLEVAKIDEEKAITIFNIDTFRPHFRFPEDLNLNVIDGYLEVFRGSGPNWSYVRPFSRENRRVLETSEKVVISDLCCTGLYYFRKVDLFKTAFTQHVSNGYLGELYVAPLYNILIRSGSNIHYHEIKSDQVNFCGVPAEYEALKQKWKTQHG